MAKNPPSKLALSYQRHGYEDEEMKEEKKGADLATALAAEFKKEGGKQVNPDLLWHKFMTKDGKINPVQGVILERRERPDNKTQHYYVMALTRPAILSNSDGEEVEAPVGSFAWIDERWCLTTLQSYLPTVRTHEGLSTIVAVSEVLIVPIAKRELKGGHSVWRADVMARPRAADNSIPLIAPHTSTPPFPAPEDKAEIPF